MGPTIRNESNNFYPGMVCSSVEFFNQNTELKILSNGFVKPFSEAPFHIISILKEQIESEPLAKNVLVKWHPNSVSRQIEQFASCRFGGLDFRADIKDGNVQDGEFHYCSKRSTCEASGILCKLPIFNNVRLTQRQVRLMVLLTTVDTNDVIAEKMNFSLGSFHLFKKELYQLLKVETKQEVALISRNLNLV